MSGQLELAVPAPGYYSYWAETANRMSGSGGVSWHPDEHAAREHAIASFNSGYKTWPESQRPVPTRISVELLAPGPDLGPWGSLTPTQRHGFTKDHPWFTGRKATA